MKIFKWQNVLALLVALNQIIIPELFNIQKIKPAIAQTTLEDIQNHFAQGCLENLLDRKIISGDYESQTFRPNQPVNRAEFAAMVTQAFPNTKLVREPMNFVDVPQAYWAYDAIQKSYEMGFLSGYIGKTFNPTLKIKRWQVLIALSSGLNYQTSGSVEQNLNRIFDDAEAIPEEAKKAIAAATANGIVVNFPNVKRLNPEREATRSDVATFLCQAIANTQNNNDTFVSQVPSQYIAKISIDGESTTTATLPETTVEEKEENTEITESTTRNNNSEITAPSSTTSTENTETTESPGIVERFGNGNLQAEIIYEQANNTDLVSDLRLKIIRSGEIVFNEPVPIKSLADDSEIDNTTTVLAGRFVKVQLLDLDGNGESEVLVDLVTLNNSDVPLDGGTYSLIYRYQPTQNNYKMLRHFWGNVNYRLTDLDRDNIPEFKSVDSRFANVFSNTNDSALPIQIWQYRQGKMSDVTREYPVQINTNASELWLEFYRRSSQNQDVKGVLAAYLANKYLLGEKEEGWKLIEKVYQNRDRERYFASLREFLADNGYNTNQGTRANVIVPENSVTETEENVSFSTNQNSSQGTVTDTENTENSATQPLENSSQTTVRETENTETRIRRPPENSSQTTERENTETRIRRPPENSSQATVRETENTERRIRRPPASSSQTTAAETTSTNSEIEQEPDINNEQMLAPRLVRSLSNQQPDTSFPVVISFDGEILASSRGKDILIWNLQTGELLNTLSEHTANVRSVAISPDGKTLASGSGDGKVKLWDIPTGEMLTSFIHSGVVTAVGFTADGRAVVGCSADRNIKLWDIYTGQLLHTMNGTQPIAFGADGLRMVTSGGPRYIRLWNVDRGQLLTNLPIPNINNNPGIQAIALSQDGQTIAHAMRGENQILVWDVETWKVRYTLDKHSQAIKAIAISPDNKIIASSSEDGKINLWDISTGKLLRSIKGSGGIVFSPDSQQIVTVAEDNTIQLWQIYGSVIEQ
ncbi:MAG: S-layer homology domain-containing protein [Trichodesmium sp.]